VELNASASSADRVAENAAKKKKTSIRRKRSLDIISAYEGEVNVAFHAS
jgi:hypothetical protein